MFQGTQIQGGGFTAPHQKHMPQPLPFAAARAVIPTTDQSFGHHQRRGKKVEEPQHHAGVVIQMHQVQDEDKDQDTAAVDDGDAGAAFRQAAQAGNCCRCPPPSRR